MLVIIVGVALSLAIILHLALTMYGYHPEKNNPKVKIRHEMSDCVELSDYFI